MLEAGVNCLPLAFLFLALSAMGFAALPRATSFIGYGVVVASFLWELLGAVLGAPHWTLGLSPFHHIGLVPVAAFRPFAACAMLAIGVAATALALVLFERRDLTEREARSLRELPGDDLRARSSADSRATVRAHADEGRRRGGETRSVERERR